MIAAPALLHRGQEFALEPRPVRDDIDGRTAPDQRVLIIRKLRRRMVPPHPHLRHLRVGHPGPPGEQALCPVLVEAHHREPAVLGHLGRVRPGDQAVRVARVADHEHTYVRCRLLGDGTTLRLEDPAVDAEQVLPFHSCLAGHRPDQQSERGAPKGRREVARRLDVDEKGEGAVLQLHHDTLERLHSRLDLEQAQHDRLVLAEHLTGRDAEEQRVADLAGGPGDGHVHRPRTRGRCCRGGGVGHGIGH